MAVGFVGTGAGDYIIKNHLHGDTQEKHEHFCRQSFQETAAQDPSFTFTEQDIRGCATEKRRGYLSASKAHKEIRKWGGGSLAILLPATFFFRSRAKNKPGQENKLEM